MTVEEKILHKCVEKNLTLALAESCTGGALAARITNINGASQYFLGSIVCYSNEIKTKFLNVDPTLINKYGASSQEVTEALWSGVLSEMNSDLAIAITGIAGPSGGTKDVPVGTVFITIGGIEYQKKDYKLHFFGTRSEIISQAVNFSLENLLALLQ